MPNDTKPVIVNDDILAPNINPVVASAPPPPVPNQSSVAPTNDILNPTSNITFDNNLQTPRKKFAGGKVIATILGLFLLVGGVGAGLFLVQQNQNPEEKAAIEGACNTFTTSNSCGSACSPNGFQCKWSSTNQKCNEGAQTCDGGGGGGPTQTEIVPCPAPGGKWGNIVQCGNIPGSSCGGFCIIPVDKTCNQMLQEKCNFIPTTGASCSFSQSNQYPKQCACSATPGGRLQTIYFDRDGSCNSPDSQGNELGLCGIFQNAGGVCSGSNPTYTAPDGSGCWTWTDSGITIKNEGNCSLCNAHKHTCNFNTDTSGGCNTTNPNIGKSQTFNGQCGQTQQIDILCGNTTVEHRSKIYPDCTPKPPTVTNPPATPTVPPITAQCRGVVAYTETWTAISGAQLSQLKAGNKVNFCVTGAATGGSFTKARFTINTVLQPETSTKRPSSEDYCQLYTIPATVSVFNVTAQIYHATLGWK